MKKFEHYISAWNQNAREDPYWAVLTDQEYEQKPWPKDLFFASGKEELKNLFRYIQEKNLSIPTHRGVALDFGCGLGRLTHALTDYFPKVIGVDISEEMIKKARAQHPTLEFVCNPSSDLLCFEDQSFDFIYSNIVFQHIGKPFQVHYIEEFYRILRKGGWLILQIPSRKISNTISQKMKHAISSCLPYQTKRFIQQKILRNQAPILKNFDIELNCIPMSKMRRLIHQIGFKLEHLTYTNSTESNFSGHLKFYQEDDLKQGYESPLYFLQK